MVKIRLMRVGKKKQPMWRVVVADSRSPRDGRIIEAIGHYQPQQDPSLVNIDNERALYWLQRGAQPSGSVRHLLQISGAWTDFTGEPQKTLPGTPGAPRPSKKQKATVAASVTEGDQTDGEEPAAPEGAEAGGEETPAPDGDQEVAETPEAADQQDAAPEADNGEKTE